jgi:hypothetical protein
MFPDSLYTCMTPCINCAPDTSQALPPVQAPYEGALTAFIICLTVFAIALIIKSLLIKLHEQKAAITKTPESHTAPQEAEQRQRRKDILLDKLLAFQENLAKEGNKNDKRDKVEEEKYRQMIQKYIDELGSSKTTERTGTTDTQKTHA